MPRSACLVLTLLLLNSPILSAQASFRPLFGLGPELLETTSPLPGPGTARTSGFAPGYGLELGLGYLPPGSSWGAELRGSLLRRSQHAVDGCLNSAPDDCTLETQTRVTGLSLSVRFSPRAATWLQPYLRTGVGLYHVYHSEPTAVVATSNGARVQRDTRSVTTPAVVAGAGLQVGRGRPQVFLEGTFLQYLRTAPRERSLPLLIGLRL